MSILNLPALPDLAGLFWLAATCAGYVLMLRVRKFFGGSLAAQPLLWVSLALIIILSAGDLSLENYRGGADWLLVALALSTAAIAVPIFNNRQIIRAAAAPFFAALIGGAAAAILFAIIPAYLLGLPEALTATLATKSVTAPISMNLANEIGGLASLAALTSIITGNIAVLMSPLLFRWAGIGDARAQGLALGVIATGIGTAEAVRASELKGSFAGLAMGANGVLTGFLLPYLM